MGILFCFVLKKIRKFKFDYSELMEVKNIIINLILNFYYVIEIVIRYKQKIICYDVMIDCIFEYIYIYNFNFFLILIEMDCNLYFC